MEISCWMINKKNFTLGFDGHFTSTKFMWGGEIGVKVQISKREFYTHLYLDYVSRISILCKKKKIKNHW